MCKCEICNGNDMDAPCAYPAERFDKCLRTKRLNEQGYNNFLTSHLCKCKKPNVQDLTGGLGPIRHYIAHCCGSHIYDDRHYTKKEWDAMINKK